MFHRQRKSSLSAQSKSLKDLIRMVTAEQFLSEEKRQALLQKMRALSGLEASRYESLCSVLIENLVNYCQNLPETANSYYSQSGGMVEHALNRTEAALSLFKEFTVQEQPDLLSEEQKLWQYALYSAAILQGIGKLFDEFRINLFDGNGQLLKQWNPLLESLIQTGSYYDYQFEKEADAEFRRRLNLLLARALMPVSGFAWIASNPEVLAVWLALLNEDYHSAGTLGAILIRADAIAIQRYFLAFMARSGARRSSRYGRAVTFTGGVPESITEKEQAIGVEFIQWLIKSLDEGRIMVNKAPLFMVPGGMLMCPEMFQLFVREHPEYKNWQAIQNGFLSLGLHSRDAGGNVTSRFEQAHTQQMYTGVVFAGYGVALPNSVQVHHLNTGKIESMSALELIHKSQYTSQFTQQPSAIAITPLQRLAANGQWQNIEQDLSQLAFGAKRGA
ncbi:conjugal transfer nickase/helicase domain-containing protein [Legionella pneumophila]|uniref:Helicase/relaxase n=1 Tax=Legionella pneumophila subsp. pascullei TaxID=91890 RepID=A0AAX2J220_LEGPN|nr:TraI domain-containing protein [Legionella pneumophila]SQG91818.1 putative helicase/relaxase [Legionella pneumophila subsp. pascullei]VEH08364.1 putative helicase/relaxase [Legionella pneumophila subsp. pascullei]HDU8261574.1 TraI domain-containing protein [Legionella pneumophila]